LSVRYGSARPRFRTRDRFALAPEGRKAEAAYRALIVAARKDPARGAFDAARAAWADALALAPDDGVYLGELRGRDASLVEIAQALLPCGLKRVDATAALERLVDAGLVTALE
jgi:hypothetical protein